MPAYSDIESHRGMVFDEVRNRAYARALQAAIEPGMTVLDLGAGLGIHGLMAARLGAGKVYLVDPSPVVLQAAELARVNGVEDRVEIIHGGIEDIGLPEPVDVIVSVLTGHFLLTEDLLPLLFLARDRFLKPGGRLVPGQARMHAALVKADDFYADRVSGWSRPVFGMDFGPARKLASNHVFYANPDDMEIEQLSEAGTLLHLDMSCATSAACKSSVELTVTRSGACHGVLGWFDMELGGEWVSTGPGEPVMHWSQAFLPLDPPLEVTAGETVRVDLDRPEFGEWTWTVSQGNRRQRHSTFNTRMADLDFLKSQAGSFIPGLGKQGELARHVLDAMAKGHATDEILRETRVGFSDRFHPDGQLDRLVRGMIAKWKSKGD